VIMELAWKHKIMDVAMPYMIQVMREQQTRIEKLEIAEKSRKEETKDGQPATGLMYEPQLMLTYGQTGMMHGKAAQQQPLGGYGHHPQHGGYPQQQQIHPGQYGYPGM